MTIQKLLLKFFSLPPFETEKVFCFYLEKKKRLGAYRMIHLKDCELLPTREGRTKLGYFESYESLLESSRKKFGEVRLCQHCCRNSAEI